MTSKSADPIAGERSGNTIFQNTCILVQPSSFPASNKSPGISRINPSTSQATNGAFTDTWASMGPT